MLEEQKLEIESRYRAGESLQQLAICYGFKSHVSILKMLEARNVPRRTTSEAMRGLQNARKYNLDQHFFARIDSESKAYYLGLLFADGWVCKNGNIGLSSIDSELVYGFSTAIQATYPIVRRQPKRGRLSYEIVFGCRSMASDLICQGCVPTKSLILEFPPYVPFTLQHHFIRGLFDGDGSVQKNGSSVNLCGSKSILLSVVQWLHQYGGLPRANLVPHGNAYRIFYNGRVSVFKFRLIIYKNATIRLSRKWDRIILGIPHYEACVPIYLRSEFHRIRSESHSLNLYSPM